MATAPLTMPTTTIRATVTRRLKAIPGGAAVAPAAYAVVATTRSPRVGARPPPVRPDGGATVAVEAALKASIYAPVGRPRVADQTGAPSRRAARRPVAVKGTVGPVDERAVRL